MAGYGTELAQNYSPILFKFPLYEGYVALPPNVTLCYLNKKNNKKFGVYGVTQHKIMSLFWASLPF